MPCLPGVRVRTTTTEAAHLPAPATKLVVTQYLKTSLDPPFWAWIIVGAFYDSQDNIIWSTEVFAAHLGLEYESDEGESEAEAGSDDEVVVQDFGPGSAHFFAVEETTSSASDTFHPIHSIAPHYPQSRRNDNPTQHPQPWNPTTQGPVQGRWLAAYDAASRNWVHSWQPEH